MCICLYGPAATVALQGDGGGGGGLFLSFIDREESSGLLALSLSILVTGLQTTTTQDGRRNPFAFIVGSKRLIGAGRGTFYFDSFDYFFSY